MATKTKDEERVDHLDQEATSTTTKALAKREPAVTLPDNWAKRGATEAEWRTMFNLYPGAHPASVLMVWDYCKARGLDPLKKPCHIVPMRVKTAEGRWETRDIVMAGIYEYRTTAHRTGQYAGHAKPEFGDNVVYEELGYGKRTIPEWCCFTVYRWNPLAQVKGEYAVTVWFEEVVTLKDGKANERWLRSPRQMLTKCAESAALREAFPDELGGTHTAEEMEGRVIDASAIEAEPETRVAAPEGYGAWFDSLVEHARRGAAAMQQQFADGPEQFREHLTLHSKDAWEALKATAVAVGP